MDLEEYVAIVSVAIFIFVLVMLLDYLSLVLCVTEATERSIWQTLKEFLDDHITKKPEETISTTAEKKVKWNLKNDNNLWV